MVFPPSPQNIFLCASIVDGMLVIKELKESRDQIIERLAVRGKQDFTPIVDEIIKLDGERIKLQQDQDEILTRSNQMAKKIGGLMKEGKRDEADEIKKETGELKNQGKKLSSSLAEINDQLKKLLYEIPNTPNELVKPGKTDEDNELIRQEGEEIDLGSNAKPHWDLIEEYKLIDFEIGNKVTGAGFPFYLGKGSRLVRSMINLFLDRAAEAGYNEVQPPIVINEESGLGTGQLPDKEGQMYRLEDTDMYLIPTAEVPITNMYRNEIISESQLPIKNAGFTPCFRREAGSWGSHVRGLNRLHQFDKVEIVQIVEPSRSYDILDEMVAHVESLVKSLELPYRVLRLCGGDLGFSAAITYDFEVYSAGQKKWLEVSSVSNFENYQSNRLKLRIKDSNGKKRLAHTLNGSALAIPRILAAVLENNQDQDCIHIPEILRQYTGFEKIERPD